MANPSSKSSGQDSTGKNAGLPLLPEILELIFWEMDPSTFFIALQTCKQFAEAGSTRKNLLRQIRQLPGAQPFWDVSIENLCYEELRQRCCQHAAKSGCMAGTLADLRGCKLPSGTIVSKSAFSAHVPVPPSFSHSQKSHMALANEDGTITIYSLANHDTKLTLNLNPLSHKNSQSRTKIRLLAFSRKGDLVVLHGSGVRSCEHHETIDHYIKYKRDGAIGESDDFCRVTEIFELTIFNRCTGESENPVAYRKAPRRSQILSLYGAEPVSIALGCNGNASIAWKVHNSTGIHEYIVELLRMTVRRKASLDPRDRSGNNYSSLGSKRFSVMLVNMLVDPTSCNSVRMKFVERERAILISNGALPLYHYISYANSDAAANCYSLHNQFSVRLGLGLNRDWGMVGIEYESLRIGMPFYRSHDPDHPKGLRTPVPCFSTYLALGIIHVVPNNLGRDYYLYVLKAQQADNSSACRRFPQIERVFLDIVWSPVALLAGWYPSQSSVGSLLEITPQGNRIAAADWDRVLIWTICPEKLCEECPKAYFPTRDYNDEKDLGRIRPVLLPSQGVVHAMKWINQDVLFALTDRGLVSWDVGPNASGKRLTDID